MLNVKNVKNTLAAALVAGAAGLALPAASTSAAALPLAGLEPAIVVNGQGAAGMGEPDARIEQARWVCGPYRCWRQPNYYGYGYGPGWGWRGHWRRW